MTNLTDMTAAALSAYFAQLTGKTVKPGSYSKAAWIAKVEAAEATVLAQEVEAPAEDDKPLPSWARNLDLALAQAKVRKKPAPAKEPEVDAELVKAYGLDVCPHCGVHLSNGVGHHGDEVNGKRMDHDSFEFCCLGCNEEFGPAIKADAPTTIKFEGPTFTLVQVAAALTMSPKAARAKYRRYENDGVSTRYVFDNNAKEVARVVAVLKGKRG